MTDKIPALVGWQLVGTNKWWPVILGERPAVPGAEWRPIYRGQERADG